jgi:phosphate transport system protein
MEKRIRKQFTKELENIKKRILALGAMVEERVRMAIKAIDTNDADLAQKIIKSDYEIDEIEVEIEEECLKDLARHQPMAIDLRFIIAVIKINAELERLADHATNIAEEVVYLVEGEIIRHAPYPQA